MPLATPDSVRSEGNLPPVVQDSALTPHIDTAAIEIKRLVGAERYTLIKSYEGSADELKSQEFKECQKAESNLAMSYAIPRLNIETTGSGIVKVKGWDENRSEVMNMSEIDKLSVHFRGVAMQLISPYLPVIDDPATEEGTDGINGGDFSMFAL